MGNYLSLEFIRLATFICRGLSTSSSSFTVGAGTVWFTCHDRSRIESNNLHFLSQSTGYIPKCWILSKCSIAYKSSMKNSEQCLFSSLNKLCAGFVKQFGSMSTPISPSVGKSVCLSFNLLTCNKKKNTSRQVISWLQNFEAWEEL